MPQEAPLLYRPEEAARLLGLGRSTIYALIARGEINIIKIGRSTRIPRTVLEQYVVSSEVEGDQEVEALVPATLR